MQPARTDMGGLIDRPSSVTPIGEANMRQPPPAGTFLGSGVEEVVERLARLEEQMRHVAIAVEKLANRDDELEESLRAISDRFNSSLAMQREMFQASLKEVTESFVSREDWIFWKNLLMAAFIGLIAFGWNSLIAVLHR